MPMKAVLTCLILLTAAFGAIASGQAKPTGTASRGENPAAKRGMAFAQSHCTACHAVDAGISPKPEAPSFEAIVNTTGLAAETLKSWLRDSHNYPEIMNFAIAPAQIDDLATYMLTLKNPGYRPPIQ